MATAAMFNTTQDKTDVLALIARMARARYDRDAGAIAAPYERDAAVYNLAPPLVHAGVDVAETQAWLDTWATPITIQPRDFEVRVDGDTAFAYGYMRMQGRKKGADHDVDFWMRETLCLARDDEAGWKIVHEHTSVPFYMDGSNQPAFDLAP